MSARPSPEVAAALEARAPVVALESTLVAHGLPWPRNLEVARELEASVRAGGAAPATIAIVDGEARLGLSDAELERLARDGAAFTKVGAQDLAVAVARRACAATTVSATAHLAARAGVRVFATGGIGGVHRGEAFDVSHDLVALARTPIAVVSAGAKSLLDLARTLEALETLGVLVLGFRCDDFPAFYRRSSGLRVPHRVDSAAELAAIARVHWEELNGGGILVANPIPSAAEVPAERIDAVIDRALAEAEARHVVGKALTPFLLAEIAKAPGGHATEANRALALHNAAVAAELAVALASV
ncbi:MAG: pseudouridine-5'-phosphate glycosidase [Kofleriaceae bacterium]